MSLAKVSGAGRQPRFRCGNTKAPTKHPAKAGRFKQPDRFGNFGNAAQVSRVCQRAMGLSQLFSLIAKCIIADNQAERVYSLILG